MQNYKYRNCLQLLFLLMVTAFVTVGCAKDDLSQCNNSYKFIFKASDADNGDISNTGAVKEITLYVFDDSKNYLETHKTKMGELVELDYPSLKMLHIVAWGNLAGGNQQMPVINSGDHLETAFIALHTTTRASSPIAQSPDDLFHEYIDVTRENIREEKVLTMRRRTSSVTITTRKLKEYASTTDDNFSYILRETTDKLDFYGNITGTSVHYNPEATFDNAGQFVSPIFNILPTTTDIEIDIYHGSALIAIVNKDGKGRPLKSVEGKLLNVLIDFGGDITVDVKVTDWGKKEIWKEF